MFSQLASFNLIKDSSDELLTNGGNAARRCVIIVSEKFKAYYLTYTKNAHAFYYSFISMFKGIQQSYGSARMRELISQSDPNDWKFFLGKELDLPFFRNMQQLDNYEELVNYRARASQSAVINCDMWTVRDNDTGLVRFFFSALPVTNREIMFRFRRTVAALQRIHSWKNSPRVHECLYRSYQNAVDATITEDFSGFTFAKVKVPLEFRSISTISKTANDEYFKPWASRI